MKASVVIAVFALFLLVLPVGCGSRQESESAAPDGSVFVPLTQNEAALAFTGDAMDAAVRAVHSAAGDGIDTARFTQPFTIPIVRADGSVTVDDTTWYILAYDDERLYACFFVFQPETAESPQILSSANGIAEINRLMARSAARELRLVTLPDLPGTTGFLCFVDADGRVFPLFRKDPEDRAPVTVGYLPALTPQLILPMSAQGLS